MTSHKYDYLVFIGRFQPFHTGHLMVLTEALARARRVIILVGSSGQARSPRNPWLMPERAAMIHAAVPARDRDRLHIVPLLDYLYDDQNWIANVQAVVAGILGQHYNRLDGPLKMGVIGHDKDSTSYYLKLFPQWDVVEAESQLPISATPLRESYFTLPPGDIDAVHQWGKSPLTSVPPSTVAFLEQFVATPQFIELAAEAAFVQRYRKEWEVAPYPPVFVTVDAVVFQAGHVLLVRRGMMPGKGLMALPGGFIAPEETLVDSMVRELREETGLRIPAKVMRRAEGPFVFDHPHRSSRGRTITHAYRLHLEESEEGLPAVRGGDDAKDALWVPLGDLDPSKMYEDHSHIIRVLMAASLPR